MTRKIPIEGGNATPVAISSPELDIALSALRDSLRGASDKTLTDIDAGIGAKTDAAATDSTSSWSLTALGKGILSVAQSMQVWWANRLGKKTAATSLSMTQASDDSFYVVPLPDITASGIISALYINDSTVGGSVKVAVPDGYRSVTAYVNTSGNISGAIGVYARNAAGDDTLLRGVAIGNLSSTQVFAQSFAGSPGYQPVEYPIPAGSKYISLQVSSYVSGSATAVLVLSQKTTPPLTCGAVVMQAGTNRLGSIQRVATWTRESTTPVNANQTISGAAKTTFNTSSGTALNTSTSYGDKFAAFFGSDVAGTLVIYASPDGGTTLYPVDSATLTQVGGAGNFGAYLEVPICENTMLAKGINGATNQARALLLTKILG